MTARPCPHEDPNCTGKHDLHAGARETMCPSAREKARVKAAEYRDENRRRTQEVKIAGGCIDCGYNAHPEALDFDHRAGVEKLFSIGQSMTKPWDTILAEIAKCDVRCANCHRIITAERRKEGAT